MSPKAVTLKDEHDLLQRFEDLERLATEEDGDAPDDDM
jgi:hypothetical protein